MSVERVLEDHEMYQVIEVGGFVHYSEEFRAYLMGLPVERRHRIVAEMEERARPRRIIRYKHNYSTLRILTEGERNGSQGRIMGSGRET